MNITIQQLDERNFGDLNRCDGAFTVDSRLILSKTLSSMPAFGGKAWDARCCSTPWARTQQLAGVMLETQNNNVAACRLYESGGFQLVGFDRCLYRGLHPGTDEIALYWYLVFAAVA